VSSASLLAPGCQAQLATMSVTKAMELLILQFFLSPLQELVQLNKKYADQGLVIMAWCGSLSAQQQATWHTEQH
jgi:hypothetical protein